MIEAAIVVVVGLVMAGLSIRADARFRDQDRLPMQWSSSGEVTWTAPRALALSLVPALALAVLAPMAAAMLCIVPRPGQEHLQRPVLAFVGAAFVAAHLLHLWLVDRSLRRG